MTAPGWYPDGHGNTRYWNGQGWAEQTAPAPAGGGAPSYQPQGPRQQPRKSPKWPWIVAGVVVLIIIIAVAAGSKKKTPTASPATSIAPIAPLTSAATTASKAAVVPPAPAKPSTLLDLQGSGAKNTASFTAPSDWQIKYTYDCSSFGQAGNFIVTVNDSATGSPTDIPVSETKTKNTASSAEHTAGRFYLAVDSECDWHITVTT